MTMKKIFTSLFLLMMGVVCVNAQDYTTMPENGSVVEILTDVTITWNDTTAVVSVDPMLMVGGAKAYVKNGSEKVFVTDLFCGPATGNAVTMSMMTAASDAGDYIIEIAQGMFTVNETVVDAFSLNYSIGGVPTSMATFDVQLDNGSLSNILLTVSPCEALSLNAESTEKIQIIHNAGFSAYYAATYTPTITGSNTATLATTTALANGNYTLIIPKGVFMVDDKVNPEIVREFDLSEVNPAEKMTVTPADGSILETLADITITWDNATTVTVDPEMMVGGAKVYRIGAEEQIFVSDIFCGPTPNNSVTLSLMSATNDAGDYVITIPTGMFTVDEIALEEFNLNYTIDGLLTSPATFDVQLVENSINDALLTITPCDEVTVNAENTEPIQVIHNVGFDSYFAAQYDATITGANTVSLHANKQLGQGSYSLIIPKGYFIVDGMINPEIVKEFDTSGVAVVGNDADVVNVYNLNGVQLVNGGTEADLNSLQPGIYIINGEKKFIHRNK